MKNRSILYIVGALGCFTTVQAQVADTTQTQSLTVERAYSPVIQDASKIDRQPAVEEIKVSHINATYADVKNESVQPNEIHDMRVGQVFATDEETESGYVSLSMGSYWNTDLKAGYRKGDFSVDAAGFFTSGSLDTPFKRYESDYQLLNLPHTLEAVQEMNSQFSEGSWNSNLCRGRITGSYSHLLDNDATLDAHATLAGAFCNNMNYDIVPYIYLDADGNTQKAFYQEKMSRRQSQHWGQILLDAQYVANGFDLKVEYEHAGIKTPDLFDNSVALSGNLLLLDEDQWLVTTSLNSGLYFGDEGNHFTIKPEIEASFMPDAYSWKRLFARLGVGNRRESMFSVMNRMPLAYMHDFDNTFDIFDLTLGWEDSEHGWFKYGVSANFKYSKDELNAVMCSNGLFEPAALDSSIVYSYFDEVSIEDRVNVRATTGTYAMLTNKDCMNIRLEAHADYEYNRFFGAKGQIVYNFDNSDLGHMGEPHFMANLHLLGHVRKLDVDLGFEGGFDREMSVYTLNDAFVPKSVVAFGELDTIDLGNIANINVRVDYKYSNAFTCYAFVNNLLNKDYQLWATVPAQGITFHAGMSYKF